MNYLRTLLACVATVLLALLSVSQPAVAEFDGHHAQPRVSVHLLASGLAGGSGSTIGPDGALYIPEPLAGRVTRIDPQTGDRSTFATGLPVQLAGIGTGGVMDVAFLGHTLYALVTLVAEDAGGTDVVGVYRMAGPDTFTVVADLGAWSMDHPPHTSFFVPTGVQYAMQAYRGGFLVTDGHHNRVLWVSRHGDISQLITFGNIVPTGLETKGRRIFMAEAGPVPHRPDDGKVVTFLPGDSTADEVASGASILTDVEFDGSGDRLYAISNGAYSGNPEGSPGLPNTGSLVQVDRHGDLDVVKDGLDRPTSLEFIGRKAFVVSYAGEVWTIQTSGCDRR